MDQLQLPQAKLLYCISELCKAQQISDSEKTTIKGLNQKFSHYMK